MTRKSMTWVATVLAMAVVPVFGPMVAVAAPQQVTAGENAAAQAATRKELAQKILDDKGITLLNSHVGGQSDPKSTAWRNIKDTSKGKATHTSPWNNDVGVTKVRLDKNMLKGMVMLGRKYDYRVTAIAGGDHGPGSHHYSGTAFDIDLIDGQPVGIGNPKVTKVKAACARLGAIEILGPGDSGHDSHVHCAWNS
jgi:zinc D-Ala-D-Ala carboxypeptidase